jgi:hypothetical protein
MSQQTLMPGLPPRDSFGASFWRVQLPEHVYFVVSFLVSPLTLLPILRRLLRLPRGTPLPLWHRQPLLDAAAMADIGMCRVSATACPLQLHAMIAALIMLVGMYLEFIVTVQVSAILLNSC